METFTSTYQPITEDDYRKTEQPVTLLYIDTVDGIPVEKGYAVAIASYYNGRGDVMRTCFLREGNYYTCEANVTHADRYIVDCDAFEFTQGNKAFTVNTKKTSKHINQSIQ